MDSHGTRQPTSQEPAAAFAQRYASRLGLGGTRRRKLQSAASAAAADAVAPHWSSLAPCCTSICRSANSGGSAESPFRSARSRSPVKSCRATGQASHRHVQMWHMAWRSGTAHAHKQGACRTSRNAFSKLLQSCEVMHMTESRTSLGLLLLFRYT